jgi:diadenosine tetraphosphate (Ap4A) HIT family hydrolase
VAQQAARLADRLHKLAGKYGHDVPAGTWLGALIPPILQGGEELQNLAVAYERCLGASWHQIGEIAGLDAGEAEDRWGKAELGAPPAGAGGPPADLGAPPAGAGGPPADLGALVRELDYWYVRHMWLDDADMADVPDPVNRLLDASASCATPSCLVCRKYSGGTVPCWAGRATPPGGHLIDDALWRVGHAPTVFAPCGSLLLESKRHFLDHSEMTADESASFGALIGRLTTAIKQVSGAERVHVYSSMDGAPHFHVWLTPRRPEDIKGRGFIVSGGYCTEAAAEAAVDAMRRVLQVVSAGPDEGQ